MARIAETGGRTRGGAAMRVLEVVLCTAVAAALCYTVQGGFNVGESVHANLVLDLAACALLQGILLFGAFRPRFKAASGIAYVAVGVAACAFAVAVAPAGNPIADQPQNLFVAMAIFVVVNLVVFLLSRRQLGCTVLFGIGAFTCGYIQFMYVTNMLVATLAFLVAAPMLMAFRSYVDTAAPGASGRLPLLAKASAVGLLVPLVACGAAAVLVIGVIMPLNPPHATLKLFNEYVAYEESHVKTAVESDSSAEKTVTSSSVDGKLPHRTTTDKKIDVNSETHADTDGASQSNANDYLSQDYSDVDLSGMLGSAQALALNMPVPWWLIVLLVIGAIVLLLTLPRYLVHRARLRRIAAQEPDEQVVSLYRFFLSRFERLGMGKPDALTPVEYANRFRGRLRPFVGAQEAGSFDHLTALLVFRDYHGAGPDREDLECMYWLYRSFYRRCRKELGLFAYAFKYLLL